MQATVGRELSSGLYYEVLGPRESRSTPILFIHGGGATGTTYRMTFDGRLGWADLLAQRGYRSWVTDWPGAGRSGYRDLLTFDYNDAVAGYLALLRDVIGEPVVVVPHSMGGAITWKLVEELPHLVAGVIALAAAQPGNIEVPCKLVSEADGVVDVEFSLTGVRFTVDTTVPYVYEDAYVRNQAIANSTQYPPDGIPAMVASHQGMSPRMLLQRVGLVPGMPKVENPAGFAGKRIRLVAGDCDPAHPRATEEATMALLRSWGADVELAWLPDRGFAGNGHYFMCERNSDELLELFVEQLAAVTA